MKKSIATIFISLAFVVIGFGQTIPTPETIIDNYAKAIGSKDSIAKVQDITINMSGTVQGMSIDMLSQKKSPNKFLMLVTVAGMGEVQKIQSDGTKARLVAQGNVTDMPENEVKDLAVMQGSLFPEFNYTAAGVKMALIGTEKINGSDAYNIEATLGDKKWNEYYDVASGLKVRQSTTSDTPMGRATIILTFSDYKKIAGINFPFKINQDAGMFNIDMTVSKVEINKNLADSIFEIK